MDAQDQARTLMLAAAPLGRGVESLRETAEGNFEIELAGGIEVLAEFDPETTRLVLTGEIGTPAEDRRGEVAEAVLAYALLWRTTGNARVALAGSGGPLLLLADLFLSVHSAAELAGAIEAFAARLAVWRRYVAARGDRHEFDIPTNSIRV